MRPTPSTMAIAMFRFPSLRATKRVTIIKGQSTNLNIKGVFRPGTPAILIVSTATDESPKDIQNFQKYVSDILGKKWPDTELLGGRIEYGLSIAFEKRRVRRVETIDAIIEYAKTMGFPSPELVENWVRRRLERCRGVGPWEKVGGKITFSGVLGGREEVLARQRSALLLADGQRAVKLCVPPPDWPKPEGRPIVPGTPRVRIEGGKVVFEGTMGKPAANAEEGGQKEPIEPKVLKPIQTEPLVPRNGPTIRRPALFHDAIPEPLRIDPIYKVPPYGPRITKPYYFPDYIPGEQPKSESEGLPEPEPKPSQKFYRQTYRSGNAKDDMAKIAEAEAKIGNDGAQLRTPDQRLDGLAQRNVNNTDRATYDDHEEPPQPPPQRQSEPASAQRDYTLSPRREQPHSNERHSEHLGTSSYDREYRSYPRLTRERSYGDAATSQRGLERQQDYYPPPRYQERSYDAKNYPPSSAHSSRGGRPGREYEDGCASEQRYPRPLPPSAVTPAGAPANPSPAARKMSVTSHGSAAFRHEGSSGGDGTSPGTTRPAITLPRNPSSPHPPPDTSVASPLPPPDTSVASPLPPPDTSTASPAPAPRIRYHEVGVPMGLVRRHYCW